MFSAKILLLCAVAAIASCSVEIQEKYKNAKDISTHPRYQSHMQKINPKALKSGSEISPFIIGGSNAQRGQFPHQVLIYIIYPNGDVYICGGSLIQPNWVLTAGHCAYGDIEYLQVYMGIVDRIAGPASWTSIVNPPEIHVHPNYDDYNLNNDIALLKLNDVPDDLLSDPYTGLIALPFSYEDYNFDGVNGTVSGFGRTSDASVFPSEVLKYNTLSAITNQECAQVYGAGIVLDTNICAGTTSEASTCGGDSGGPYSFNVDGYDVLVGVTSFGANLGCELGYPVGFTRVTKYINWIIETISNMPPATTTDSGEVDYDNILRIIWQAILDFFRNFFGWGFLNK